MVGTGGLPLTTEASTRPYCVPHERRVKAGLAFEGIGRARASRSGQPGRHNAVSGGHADQDLPFMGAGNPSLVSPRSPWNSANASS